MLSWSQTQKFKLVGTVALIIAAAIAVWSFLPERSSCSNSARDGNERGVDCGGSCALLCRGEARDPIVHFARAVPVSDGVWGAVAYLENKNEHAAAWRSPYLFKLYDAENLLLYERRGEAYIPPRKVFAIFEGRMRTGNRVPARAVFSFTAPPRFETAPPALVLPLRNQQFSADEFGSRLEAVVSNPTLAAVAEVDATALLFDAAGNLFAASAATARGLAPRASAALVFTWPLVLDTPSRIEILYTVPGR